MKKKITVDNLESEINEAVPKLLEMSRKMAWNKISSNCLYIHSEIKDSDDDLLFRKNAMKPKTLEALISTLTDLYPNFYDINLYIYKASKQLTIIDVRYYCKSSLDPEFFEKAANKTPMLHCKVPIPIYAGFDKPPLFDINWKHNTLWHRWEDFLLKTKFRLGLMGYKKPNR